jgi:mRNA-degrading endonuclease RelE of RelBE toxin-antitoxin system
VLHRDPKKYLKRLPEPDKGRIDNAINRLKKELPEGNITPINGRPGVYRVRIGGYRITYREISNDEFFVMDIDPRGQAYKVRR